MKKMNVRVSEQRRMNDISLGELIHLRRRRAGLTLKQLAEEADVSISYLSEIERFEQNATIPVLQRVCAALGMKISISITENDDETPING